MFLRIALASGSNPGRSLPVLPIEVHTPTGKTEWTTIDFVLDTGADCSLMPADVAEGYGVHYDRTRMSSPAKGIGGSLPTYLGSILIRIRGEETWLTCKFTMKPNTLKVQGADAQDDMKDVPAPAAIPSQGARDILRRLHKPLLGRRDFLNKYEVRIDSDYLLIVRRGPIREFFRNMYLWCLGLLGRFTSISSRRETS